MSSFQHQQQKIPGKSKKCTKVKSEESQQSSEPDSDIAHTLELSEKEFKITMFNIIRTLMEKVENI